MGKAPEKVNGSANMTAPFSVKRYQRKASSSLSTTTATANTATTPTAAGAASAGDTTHAGQHKPEDNQLEHREAEPVGANTRRGRENQREHGNGDVVVAGPLKAHNSAYARKKKPKAALESTDKAVDVVHVAAPVATGKSPRNDTSIMAGVSSEPAGSTMAKTPVAPKKKLKKRQLMEKSDNQQISSNQEQHQQLTATEPSPQQQKSQQQQSELESHADAKASVQLKPVALTKQQRKRTQPSTEAATSHSTKEKAHPSLLKQLLWKAKPVAPALSPSSSSSSSSASSSRSYSSTASSQLAAPVDPIPIATTVRSSPSTTTTQKPQSKPPLGSQHNQQTRHVELENGDREEEEEVAYTVRERQSRKLQANKRVLKTKNKVAAATKTTARPPSPPKAPAVELSSQETQSGSEEDEATATSSLFLAAYQHLAPPQDNEQAAAAIKLEANVYFPAPFPLALATHKAEQLMAQHGITVHHVLIEDFAFHPPQLRICKGDVVVWTVSNQTMGMVEHALEISMLARKAQNHKHKKDKKLVKATTPPLGSGCAFAWRFPSVARVHVECSVYPQTKSVVFVDSAQFMLLKETKKNHESIVSVETKPEPESETVVAQVSPALTKSQLKRKHKNRLRAEKHARHAAAALASVQEEVGDDAENEDAVVVFHPPLDLARSAEMDVGVCRAVLTQLEEVAASKAAAQSEASGSVIVIGDVECPVLATSNNQEDEETQEEEDDVAGFHCTQVSSTKSVGGRHAHDKLSALETVDDWSGTEEEDEEEVEEATPEEEEEVVEQEEPVRVTDEIEDFQQRIIGMLQRSEQARAEKRRSFQPEQSGFDAGAAYDFFKQRFTQVQAEQRPIVYAVCPEQPSGGGLDVTDIVRLLSGASV